LEDDLAPLSVLGDVIVNVHAALMVECHIVGSKDLETGLGAWDSALACSSSSRKKRYRLVYGVSPDLSSSASASFVWLV
jgi:hypothetical protein